MQGFEKIYVGRLFSEYLKWGVLGVWMTLKKAEMAKTLKNGLSMIKTNPLNHNWSHFAILSGLTLHQFQKILLLNRKTTVHCFFLYFCQNWVGGRGEAIGPQIPTALNSIDCNCKKYERSDVCCNQKWLPRLCSVLKKLLIVLNEVERSNTLDTVYIYIERWNTTKCISTIWQHF